MVERKFIDEVIMIGSLKQPFVFDKLEGDVRIFSSILLLTRPSGIQDEVPVSIEESLLNMNENGLYGNIMMKGHVIGKTVEHKLNIGVRVEQIIFDFKNELRTNYVKIFGEIASPVKIRRTQNGEVFCNFILATSFDGYNKEYISVVAWNNLARLINLFTPGHELFFEARFQSRKYKKVSLNGETEEKVSHELVITKLKRIKSSSK